MTSQYRRLRVGLAAVVLLASGCASGGGRDAIVIAAPPDRTTVERVSAFDLQPGDCGDPPSYIIGEITEVDLVPCDVPHTQEVIYVAPAPFETYPGSTALLEFGREICARATTEGLGVDLDSQYVTFLNPTLTSWTAGDRDIVCVIWWPRSAPATGSIVRGTYPGE